MCLHHAGSDSPAMHAQVLAFSVGQLQLGCLARVFQGWIGRVDVMQDARERAEQRWSVLANITKVCTPFKCNMSSMHLWLCCYARDYMHAGADVEELVSLHASKAGKARAVASRSLALGYPHAAPHSSLLARAAACSQAAEARRGRHPRPHHAQGKGKLQAFFQSCIDALPLPFHQIFRIVLLIACPCRP
jgi:hypothetical protein